MGVAMSTQAPIAPISLVSAIIGFASFAFTLATAIRVFWQNFSTFAGAASEIPDYLTNLRQSLHEERQHLRKARRHRKRRRSSHRLEQDDLPAKDREKSGSDGTDAAMDAMLVGLKHMLSSFRLLERPFLRDPDRSARRQKQWADDTYGYASGGPGDEDARDLYNCETRYRTCGLRERLLWLRHKSRFVGLAENLSRFTTRRTGMQVNEMSIAMRDLGRQFDAFDDRLDALDRLEHRLSKVVGVRRVE